MTAGLSAFSELNGPPGMAYIEKKVMALTMKMVKIARSTRFTTYFAIRSLLTCLRHRVRQPRDAPAAATSREAVLFANTTVRRTRTSEVTKKAPFPADGRQRRELPTLRIQDLRRPRARQKAWTRCNSKQIVSLFYLFCVGLSIFQGEKPKSTERFTPLAE